MVSCLFFTKEREKFNQMVNKCQKEISELQTQLQDENSRSTTYKMERDAKESEIEQLRQKMLLLNSETASLSSGAENDNDESFLGNLKFGIDFKNSVRTKL